MRTFPYIILLCRSALSCIATPLTNYSNQQIQHLQKKYHAQIGALIKKSYSVTPNYQKNAQKLFPPASLTKLFTASAALLYLKPQFRYRTSLYYSGKLTHNTLKGDLYIAFTGDPSLTSTNLYQLLNGLKAHHINHIGGHVYFSAAAFDAHPYPNGTTVDDLAYSYASPLSSVIINQNAFTLSLQPSANTNTPHIELSTHLPVTINNLLQQKNNSNCQINAYSHSNNHYTLEGCVVFPNHQPLSMSMAVNNPFKIATFYITQALQKLHITSPYTPRLHFKPQGVTLLSTHRSEPLSRLVKSMLKDSNNIIANALFKTLGQHLFRTQGSWSNGSKALVNILKQDAGIDTSQVKLWDGAGLSRYNLCTPSQIGKLLQTIHNTPSLSQYILPALPIAGVDGTLASRMPALRTTQAFHAKTGSMTGVSNLVGFLTVAHHQTLITVLMIHSFLPKVKEIRAWEDHLITHLAKNHQPSI